MPMIRLCRASMSLEAMVNRCRLHSGFSFLDSIQEVIKLGVEGAEMRKQRNLCSEKVWYILE